MTGEMLQTIKPPPGLVLGLDEQKWNQMIREANVMAFTKMVPKPMQGEPGVVLAAMCVCEAYGADRRLAIAQVHYMNGELVPSAQLRIGVATARGYEVSWEPRDGGLLSRRKAVLAIRRPGRRWQHFQSTHEEQVAARMFDEWVEIWSEAEHGKLKWIVRRDGQPYPHDMPVPRWAADKIAAGAIKKMDSWWDREEDMHACAASRKGIRRYAPDALLGVDSLAVSAAGDIETGEIFDVEGDVDTFAAGRETGATSTQGPESTPPAPGPASAPLATEASKRTLLRTIAFLDEDHRARLKTAAMALPADERIPRIDGPDSRFATDHLLTMLALIDATFVDPDGEFGEGTEPDKTETTEGPLEQEGEQETPSYGPGEEPFE